MNPYPVENPVSVEKFESAECHGRVCLDVAVAEKREAVSVFDHRLLKSKDIRKNDSMRACYLSHLKVNHTELEDEVDVAVAAEHVFELKRNQMNMAKKDNGVASHPQHVLMLELLEELDFAQSSAVDA